MARNDGPFELGALVCLKSGGPTMTVKSEIINPGGGNRGYWCNWFVGTALKEAAFDSVTIKAATAQA